MILGPALTAATQRVFDPAGIGNVVAVVLPQHAKQTGDRRSSSRCRKPKIIWGIGTLNHGNFLLGLNIAPTN
jgi:hypothetical protein